MSCGYGSCAVVTTNSIFSNPESNFWTSPIFVIVPSNSKEFDEARRVVGLPTRRAAPSLAAPPTKAPVPFAKALHKMLGDAPQLIRLDAEEGCVVIPSPTALEGILGKYYRHSKYASFQRQLNNFGFHRQAGAGVTIYRRSPEAGGRFDSVDAILGIRHVVRRKAAAPRPKAQLGDRYSAVSALLALKQSVAVIA